MQRKTKLGFTLAASAIVLALFLLGCANGETANGSADASTQQAQVSNEPAMTESEEGMTEEELAILKSYESMQQAMIDKDVDAMRMLTTEDKVFTHMSGKTQTREQFFSEIADGTLNYFGYAIHDPRVTIEGNRATLTGSTTLDAHVYGMSGSWTLPTNAHFIKQDGTWIQCN